MEGGRFHTAVRGTMFVRKGAVTPGPSRECDITFFVKGRLKSARLSRDSTVATRRAQSLTVPSSCETRKCCSPGLRSPPQWPRIARYRETISAIPPYCALWGFSCLNMANWVRYPPPFSARFPLWEHAKWRCDTPPSKGVSQRYLRDTLWKPGKWVRYPPLRYYLERVLRDMGRYLALGR